MANIHDAALPDVLVTGDGQTILQTNAAVDEQADLLSTIVPELAEKRVKTHLSDQNMQGNVEANVDEAIVTSSSVHDGMPKLQKRKRQTDGGTLVKGAFALALIAILFTWIPFDTQVRSLRSPIFSRQSQIPTLIYAQDSGVPFQFDMANGTALVQFRINIDKDKLDPCKEVQLQVSEGGCGGDQYVVYLDGIELGRTSVPTSTTCKVPVTDAKTNVTTIVDMSLPQNQNITLLPGNSWVEGFSTGRFSIPPGDHILTIQLVDPSKGDGRFGSIMMWDLIYYCKYQDSTKRFRGWGLTDNSDHIIWPTENFELQYDIPAGKCVEFNLYDAVCPGDRYDVWWNNVAVGTTSKIPVPDPGKCPHTQMIEGDVGDMGVDYWDLIKPSFAQGRYSAGHWILGTDPAHTQASYLLTFRNRGEVGSDYRFAFYIAKMVDCNGDVHYAKGGQAGNIEDGAKPAVSPAWSSMSRSWSLIPVSTTTIVATSTQEPVIQATVKPDAALNPIKTDPMVIPTKNSDSRKLYICIGMIILAILL